MKPYRLIGVLLVVIASVALAGVALANKGSSPARKVPQRAHVQKSASLSKPALAPKSVQSAGRSDPDTVQSGDQTSQDQPGEQSPESETENTGDSESGQPGEPAQGHEDPAGQNVNNECSGELTGVAGVQAAFRPFPTAFRS